jgi:3-hydroxybutyrate dehydrogenase
MLEKVDGEFTTPQDVEQPPVFRSAFQTKAITGQSVVVGLGSFIQ